MNPVAKSIIKTKGFENSKKKTPIKGIKCLSNVNFESKIATKSLLVKDIDCFRSKTNAFFYIPSFDEAPLLNRCYCWQAELKKTKEQHLQHHV